MYHSGFIDRSGNVLLFFEFADLTQKERLLSSFFQAVTPRTAGFNTVELTDLSEAGQFITIALMLIGGSPGSTAGGLKTTTIAVLLTTAISTFRRRENAHLFGRRIDMLYRWPYHQRFRRTSHAYLPF